MFAGRLIPVKRVDALVNASNQAIARYDVALSIRDLKWTSFENRTRSWIIGNQVTFLGFLGMYANLCYVVR